MNGRLLVVGGDGLLGGALVSHWTAVGAPVIATTRRKPVAGAALLDLSTDSAGWQILAECKAAVICAGVTNQEACRRDPLGTRRINVEQTLKLVHALTGSGCFVVFLSTNLVFDGSRPLRHADEPLCPATEYGRQKADVERALAGLHRPCAVVRLTKVVHSALPLLGTWREALSAGRFVNAFSDYVCSPIPLDPTIQCIARIAEEQRPGVWQISADDDISYLDIALSMAQKTGCEPALVRAASGVGKVEHLPQHTTLDASAVRAQLGVELPQAREAIANVISP